MNRRDGHRDQRLLLYVLLMLLWGIRLSVQVSHERNLVWAQKDEQYTGLSKIVGASGDPNVWVTNRTAATRYITAPNSRWHFVAVGFDYGRQMLYWVDAGNKKIQGLRLDGSNVAFTVYEGTSSKVEGVAVDWLAGNIYWCDAMYNWIAMAPATMETKHFKVVISTGLNSPTGVVAYPQKGLLIWSESGAIPKLEKASLSGGSRHTLVDRDIAEPMGLTIDPREERIYWVDRAKGAIESIDVYGGSRRKLFEVVGTQFFGIALYQDFVFVPDQEGRQLYVFNRARHQHEVNFKLGSAVPYGIVMYDQSSQPQVTAGCDNLSCDHLCISDYSGRASCACSEGFQLQSDAKTCLDSGKFGSPQFIYSIGNALCRFPGNLADMNLENITLDTQCFMTDRRDSTALAFNFHENSIYFAENQTKTISKARLVEGDSAPEVLLGGTGSVEGLSVDWISNNLYWTDSEFRHLMVAKMDGRFQAVFIKERVDHPRGIVVDAINRFVYWSDIGASPRIERCGLDGSDRRVMLSKQMGSPNHLVVDYITSRLYWTDSVRDSIEWMSLDGQERRVVAHPGRDLYGITIFQDYLVWTDQQSRNGLHVGIKDTGEKLRGIVHPGTGEANDVITFDASMQPLADGPCDVIEECEQLCLPSRDPFTATCKCALGFVLSGDGRTCRADAFYDNFLLFTDTYQKQIYQMSLLTGEFHAVPLSGHDNPIALDFDPVGRKIYWTDVASKVIKRSNINGTDEEIIRILDDDAVPDGIAIDPMSRLIYFTDAGNKKVVALDINGRVQATLVSTSIEHPRAIVLDPLRGTMFWTDWGLESRIEKANMDGSNRKKLVNTGIGSWPNGLAIDRKMKRIFWCDARTDQIETTDLEGQDRKVLFQEENAHFFGIVSLDSMLYYTDWTKKTIMKLEWNGDKVISSTIGPAVFARANDIHAYKRDQVQVGRSMNSCSFRNGGCSHLCIPVPEGRRCACPDGMFVSYSGNKCSGSPLYPTLEVPSYEPTEPPIQEPSSTTTTTTTPPPPTTTTTPATTTPVPVVSRVSKTLVDIASTTKPVILDKTITKPEVELVPTLAPKSSIFPDHTGYPTPSHYPQTTTYKTRKRKRPLRKRTTTTAAPSSTVFSSTKVVSGSAFEYTMYSDSLDEKVSGAADVRTNTVAGLIHPVSTTATPAPRTEPTTEPPSTTQYPTLQPPSDKSPSSDSGRPVNPVTWWRKLTPPPTTAAPTFTTTVAVLYGASTNSTLGIFDLDSSATFYGFLMLVAGGVVLFCLIVVIAVCLYKKCDASKPRNRPPSASHLQQQPRNNCADFTDPASLPPPPWNDTYEMPVKEDISGSGGVIGSVSGGVSAGDVARVRYGRMGEGYYTGEVDSGIENPGYVNRESLTSYEGLNQAGDSGGTQPSFSTFRTNSTYSLDSINSFDSFD